MKTLLYTTTAFVLCGGIVATPSCTAMGYSSTSSCDGGLKCPFGEAWNCSINDIKTEINNKINEVKTEITEIKNIIEQQQQESCIIGSILYSDMTCSVTGIAGKAPIGIVVYIDGAGGGQAFALESMGSYEWSSEYVDISGLTNYGSPSDASKDYDSCGNTAKIIAAGDKSKYPAAWAAHEYKTAETEAGDWCLPAAGILTSAYNNQEVIAAGFSRVDGTQFTFDAWSSSEYDYFHAWISIYGVNSYGLYYTNYHGYGKDYNYEVRPVIEF